ncbi:tumor necrosis factor ligand superfamily member 9 [Fukomys damarensis]|uniref:tumor necrosis factor ligand superfamily member 9 n=1 Tax=Fukomys damarensis TaxID=885580 RepID=UPI0008FF66AE|nr:tumor necrosis factor ligand superfamily member 9 [Fukomys damarensis]
MGLLSAERGWGGLRPTAPVQERPRREGLANVHLADLGAGGALDRKRPETGWGWRHRKGLGALGKEPELTARLLAQNVTLENGTLSWYNHRGLAGAHLSPGLTYDEHRQELVVAKAGHYQVCLHLELNNVLVLPTSQDSFKVSLTLHLEPPQAGATARPLAVDLTPYSSSVLVRGSRCQPLQTAELQRLSVRMSVYPRTGGGKHQAWQLAQPATKLELFRVGGSAPTW